LASIGSRVAGTGSRIAGTASRLASSGSRVPAAADNSPLAAILNFGQSAINTISTPMYGIQGFVNEAAKQARAGNTNPVDSLIKSINAGNKNATSWTRGEKTIMGEELLKNVGILKDDNFGDFKIGDITINAPGLAADILMDPLTYIPGGVFVTAVKAPLVAGRTAIKAGQLAKTGQLSESVARRAAKTPGLAAEVAAAPAGAPLRAAQKKDVTLKQRKGITPAKIELAQSFERIAKEQGRQLTKLEKTQIKQANIVSKSNPDLFAYKTLQLGSSPLNTVNNQISSALEAGRLAMMNTILSDTAKRSLRKINAREARQIRREVPSGITFNAVISAGRQAQDVDVKAGESALVLNDGSVQAVKENTLFIDGEKTHVWDGKNVWTWDKGDPTTNARLAQEYLDSKNVKPAAEIIGAPIVDSAPSAKVLKNMAKGKNKTDEVKVINKMLTSLDKISKSAKVASVTGDNVAYRVNEILKAGDLTKVNAWRKLSPGVRARFERAIAGGQGNIFDLIREAIDGQNVELKGAIREITPIVITGADGKKRSIGDIYAAIARGDATYANLSSDAKSQIRQEISDLLTGGAVAVRQAELSAIVGPETAAKILNTGVLDPSKPFQRGVLQKILADVKAAPKVAEKKYENFDELLVGLKREDQIDTSTLTKLLNAIDPENALIKQVDKIADADLNAQMASIIARKGPQTVNASRRALELLDADRVLKAEGLNSSEAVAAYINARLSGAMPPLANAADQSRQAAMTKIIADFNDVDGRAAIEKALVSLGTAVDSRMDYLFRILDAEDSKMFVSSIDDAAMRSTSRAYAVGAQAATYLQTNTNFTSALIGSLLGISGSRAVRKELSLVKKGKAYVARTPEEKAQALAQELATSEDIVLAILGVRFTAAKSAAKAIEDGLGKHFAYVHLGDMITVFDDTGSLGLMTRALFPETAKKTDSFSYYGLTEAVRMVMEARNLKVAPNRAELVKTLLSKGKAVKNAEGKVVQEAQAPWSPEFKATTKQTAEDIADHLLREDVVEIFENIHKSKAIAGVEDSLGGVVTLTQDVANFLMEGFRANKRSGNMSDAARTELAREAFARFTFASGYLEGRSGAEAATLMKIASTMFLRDGRMANIREVKDFLAENMLPSEQGQMDEMIAMIDLMYKEDSAYKVAVPGFEDLGVPTAQSIAKAQSKLTEAELQYNAHMKDWANKSSTTEGAREWASLQTKLSKKLDAARNAAEAQGIEPRYWVMSKFDETSGNDPWVAKGQYNHEDAIAKANAAESRFARVDEKLLDRGKALVDVPPTERPKKLTKQQRDAVLKKWEEATRVRVMELSDGAAEDAAQYSLDILPDLEASGMDPFSALIRAEQERIAYKYLNIQQRVDVMDPEDIAKLEGQVKTYSPTYSDVRTQRRAGTETQGRGAIFKQRWNANSNEAISIKRNAETLGFNAKNQISKVLVDLGAKLDKIDTSSFARATDNFANPADLQLALRGRLFTAAWQASRANDALPKNLGPQFEEVVKMTRGIVTAAQRQIAELNMSPKIIDRYFKKYGMDKIDGLKLPGEYTNPEEFVTKFIDNLPFNKNTKPEKTDAYNQFAQRADDFEKSGNDPYIIFSNIVSAMIDAKTEQVLVTDFVSQFGYKAQGLTMKQALDKGYVKVKAVQGLTDFDLSVHLEGLDNQGALFDPTIADMFAGLNREWSYMQSKQLGPILRYMMDFTGVLKATQTILRPGHVMTNVIGDTVSALINGAREGRHWINGMKYAKQFMSESVKADGFMFMKGDTEAALQRAVGGLMRLDDNAAIKIADANKPGYTISLNGKKVRLDDDTVRKILQESGVLTDNIINTDIQGLYEAAQARFGEAGVRGSQAKTIYARAKLRFDAFAKPAGDATAYYSNISRTASALQTMERKNWSSIEEMKRAVADSVHLYHPSIFSLTATERLYPRAIFTYYTWLRVAHNALIDMALNHTAAMMLYPKVQANAAAQANYEPMSIGDPWGVNKQSTPQYMNFSTYAPVGVEGPRGEMIMKPSYLPFDVLDTWNWTYNPYKSWDENIGGVIQQVGRTIGRSTNIVAQPGVEFLTGTDLNTGKRLQNRNLETFGDEVISNIGYGGLLKGLGVYTPANKRPENTSNPITDRDREVYLQNWLFGLKRQDLNTVSTQQNARNDQSQNLRQFMEWYDKQERDNQ
jgi:hypothetical protein